MASCVLSAEWPQAGSLRVRGWAAEGGPGAEEDDKVTGRISGDSEEASREAKHYRLASDHLSIFCFCPLSVEAR